VTLGDPVGDVRMATVENLSDAGGEQAVTLLQRFLAAVDPVVRETAVLAN